MSEQPNALLLAGEISELFSWLPEGTTHVNQISVRTIPCFGLAAIFSSFKYVDGVLHTYRTDSDNEYGHWKKAAPLYANGKTPDVYPLFSARQSAELRRLHAVNAELLKALKVLMRDFEAAYGDGGLEMQPALYQACEAIAKAETQS